MSEENIKNVLKSKLFISYGTIIGFVIFALVITIFLVLEITLNNPFSDRITTALLGITIILFLLGFIIDQLKFRDFRFWALGAIVSFTGVVFLFSPVILYGIGNNDGLLWGVVIVLGVLLILFGYTIEAYELNNKVAKILIALWENIRNFQWRKIPSKIFRLFVVVFTGIASYILLGFKQFKYVIVKSTKSLIGFISITISQIYRLLISLPRYTKKFVKFCYEYNYLLIIPLFAFSILKILNLPFPSILFYVLIFLTIFLIVLAVLQSNEELSQQYLQSLREQSWKALQSISIKIQKSASVIGKYKCSNCNAPLKLGEERCENCSEEIRQCSICKLPIKKDQEISVCSHCQYPAHTNHWKQWIGMNHPCPICKH